MAFPRFKRASERIAEQGQLRASRWIRGRWEEHLAAADIRLDGERPWDIQVHDERMFARILLDRSLGLGDSYVDGWWDSAQLDETLARLFRLRVEDTVGLRAQEQLHRLLGRVRNRQSRARASMVVERHYDLPADFYMAFLDPYNQYTCGYFRGTDQLDEAQEAKLELICRKLGLSPGIRVLDIGCGWGGFAKFAAERHGAHVTGITISGEQLEHARALTRGLSVEIMQRDYRDMVGSFDRVLVCGMIEHVGHKNYRALMEVVDRCLVPEGWWLLHTVGSNVSVHAMEPWLDAYIFPNAMLPSLTQLSRAAEGLFVPEDLQNLRPHYDKTLLAWHRRFVEHWPRFSDQLGERVFRIWSYYFLFCAAVFRVGNAQLWQLLYSKHGVPGEHPTVR